MRSDSDSPDPLSTPDSSSPKTPPNLHQNTINPDARWLVQKFGGTSVGKFAAKIASDIVSLVSQFARVSTIYRLFSIETISTTIRSPSCALLDLVPQRLWEPPIFYSRRHPRHFRRPQLADTPVRDISLRERVEHLATMTGLLHYILQGLGPVPHHVPPCRMVDCLRP